MKKGGGVFRVVFFLLVLGIVAWCALPDYTLFPRPDSLSVNLTDDYLSILHVGMQQDTFYMRGQFGVDLPIAALAFTPQQHIGCGIAAGMRLNMLPHDMKFAVDNFYALLAIYLYGQISPALYWRLYPVHHVSAHLADGHASPTFVAGVDAVSSEMIKGEVSWLPWRSMELTVGTGWYYHVCDQQELTSRVEAAVRLQGYTLPQLEHYFRLKGEAIIMNKPYWGYELRTGVNFRNSVQRGMGLALKMVNHLHPGYYFRTSEKAWGLDVLFFL